MSSYGAAVIIDIPAEAKPAVADALRDHPIAVGSSIALPDGSVRLSVLFEAIEIVGDVAAAMTVAGSGRAAVAEDNDEFGARWVMLTASGGGVRVVHRRYILNADPDDAADVAIADLETDPRQDDVAGTDAADAAAALFGADTETVRAAEDASATAWREIGSVGGPSPWWNALGLPWPEPARGEPLDW